MRTLTRFALALAAGFVALPVLANAAPEVSSQSAAAHAAKGAQIHARIATASAARAQAKSASAVNATLPGLPSANPWRAYPPSCAADPLPDVPTGPTVSTTMPLWTIDRSGNLQNLETVTVTFWRIPCSSSGSTTPYNTDGGYNAITLMRIARSAANNGRTDIFPTMPYITSDQGTSTDNLVRAALEPNTVISELPYDAPIYYSTTFVLENYPEDSLGYTYFNYDNHIIVDPVVNGVSPVDFHLEDYIPTESEYPLAFDNVPIDGYLTSAYYDPAHSGEGLLLEIFPNADGSRTFFAAWYTYDDLGLPFWITAQGVLDAGDTTVNATGYYRTGGGFAGDFTSSEQHTWGTMSFNFPDCNTMEFTFDGDTSAVDGGPGGSGSRTWQRLASVSGLACE